MTREATHALYLEYARLSRESDEAWDKYIAAKNADDLDEEMLKKWAEEAGE